jgi:hypothetical protein
MRTLTQIANVNYCFSVCRKEMEVCCLSFPFSVFHLQQINRSCHFPLIPFLNVYLLKWQHINSYMENLPVYGVKLT